MGPWLVEVGSREEFEPWLTGGPPDPGRVVVWMRDPNVLDDVASVEIFGAGDWCLAVVLRGDGTPAAWVSRDRIGVEDAAFAFAEAE